MTQQKSSSCTANSRPPKPGQAQPRLERLLRPVPKLFGLIGPGFVGGGSPPPPLPNHLFSQRTPRRGPALMDPYKKHSSCPEPCPHAGRHDASIYARSPICFPALRRIPVP